MVLSNITTPLIGLVDAAVMGHMPEATYLAGVALGGIILTQLYWICGFLRMASTGMAANAHGANQKTQGNRVLWQSLGLGLILGLLILLLQTHLFWLGVWFANSTEQVINASREYFFIRVWGAPFALMNLALIGWMIGYQMHRKVMWIQIFANVLNALLDIVFVFVFDLGIKGVALASLIAEVSIFVLSISFILHQFQPRLDFGPDAVSQLKRILILNSHMLQRNLALQFCLAFLTYKGAALGELVVATNAILMQFFVLIALGLDGLAYAVEALMGSAKGKNKASHIRLWLRVSIRWSNVIALLYSLLFFVWGTEIIALITDIEELRQSAERYLIFMYLLPIVGHWCFLYDGVFIALTRAKAMRNSMVLSALVFVASWMIFSSLENLGLWIAFIVFLAVRGMTLSGYLSILIKREQLTV